MINRQTITPPNWLSFDLLASMVWVTRQDGQIVHVNAVVQELLGLPRYMLQGLALRDLLEQPAELDAALHGASQGQFAALRCEAVLKAAAESIMVHMVVVPIEGENLILVEMLPTEQHSRQEREGRLLEQALANKELIRNLAHEIKNPLGGIRGAAQLLQMEVQSRDLIEYTQVIIREADRLQTLVDRLLEPHRKPHMVTNVNIHEVCERVRSLILAEFPQGLRVIRDYDTSLPEFRGDVEQLIQVVLNITHNAAQALSERIQAADAQITLRTRVARQVTFGKQRYKLALELHVIDNGPGIPLALQDRLFLPLVSGREGGSGLGLHLAQTFVHQHHGLIEFESVPGRTDFKILIPLP
jgi:two-component system, NtrC family, nitrogen regulation sensor histidine kinase GlnL